MPFVDTSELDVVERKPGWFGRYFDSPSMSFAHYEFTAGSTVQEHSHPQEEVWLVVEGALDHGRRRGADGRRGGGRDRPAERSPCRQGVDER
jgi:hypothetical protein